MKKIIVAMLFAAFAFAANAQTSGKPLPPPQGRPTPTPPQGRPTPQEPTPPTPPKSNSSGSEQNSRARTLSERLYQAANWRTQLDIDLAKRGDTLGLAKLYAARFPGYSDSEYMNEAKSAIQAAAENAKK